MIFQIFPKFALPETHIFAYVGMLTKFVEEITYNARHMAEGMKTPFCILFGQEDALCNIRGAWEMFLTCQRVSAEDKLLVEFEHAAHQLYLEIPQIRQTAMKDTLCPTSTFHESFFVLGPHFFVL